MSDSVTNTKRFRNLDGLTSTDFHENNLYSAQQVWSGPHTQTQQKASIPPFLHPGEGQHQHLSASLSTVYTYTSVVVALCYSVCYAVWSGFLACPPQPPLVPPVLPPCSLGVDHNHRGVRYFSHISTGTNTRCAHNVNAFIDAFLFISSFFFISSETREGLGKSTYFSMINNWRIVTVPKGACLAVPYTTF